MGEVIGVIVKPKELTIPVLPTASLPAAANIGMVYYDSTTNKIKVWTGAAYETVFIS